MPNIRTRSYALSRNTPTSRLDKSLARRNQTPTPSTYPRPFPPSSHPSSHPKPPSRTQARHPLSTRSRPDVLLILIRRAHSLDQLLGLGGRHAALLGDDLGQHGADLARHVGRVAADVEVRLLQQQRVDLGRAFFQPLLHVDLRRLLAREGRDQLEVGA